MLAHTICLRCAALYEVTTLPLPGREPGNETSTEGGNEKLPSEGAGLGTRMVSMQWVDNFERLSKRAEAVGKDYI